MPKKDLSYYLTVEIQAENLHSWSKRNEQNEQFKSVFTHANSNKIIKNSRTFFKSENPSNTEIWYISLIEDDIEEIIDGLNKHAAARPHNWNAKFLTLCKHSR